MSRFTTENSAAHDRAHVRGLGAPTTRHCMRDIATRMAVPTSVATSFMERATRSSARNQAGTWPALGTIPDDPGCADG